MTQALTALGGLFGNQSRRTVERQPIPSAIEAMTVAKDTKHLNKLRKQAREERLWAVLTQPEVLGYAMALGGLVASNNIPLSSNAEKNAFLQGLASTMSVLMGLGFAGVGDLASLSVALMAGGGSIVSGLIGDINVPDQSSITDWLWHNHPLYKIYDIVT